MACNKHERSWQGRVGGMHVAFEQTGAILIKTKYVSCRLHAGSNMDSALLHGTCDTDELNWTFDIGIVRHKCYDASRTSTEFASSAGESYKK